MNDFIINFMYGHVSRFINSGDPDTIESLNPILGGPGWQKRLDPSLPRGQALVKLFRESLKTAGNFAHVVATKIDKPTEDRPYFFMAYATKDYAGLKTFRDNEFKALCVHAANRAHAKGRKKEAKSGVGDLFRDHDAGIQESSVTDEVEADMQRAKPYVLEMAQRARVVKFSVIAAAAMENYMLRETNVKDLMVQLAEEGKLENTWGGGRHKPSQETVIRIAQADRGPR